MKSSYFNVWRKRHQAAMDEQDIVDALMMIYGWDRRRVMYLINVEGWEWADSTAQNCPSGMRWMPGDPVL